MRTMVLGGLVTAVLGGQASARPEMGFVGSLEPDPPRPIHTLLAIPSLGYASGGGWSGGLSVGYAWGRYEDDFIFPGASVSRVLVHVRRPFSDPDPATSLAITYGWLDTSLIDAGLDVGIGGTRDSIGPLAMLTLGNRGIGLRLSGGFGIIGDDPRWTGSAELAFDLARIAKRI